MHFHRTTEMNQKQVSKYIEREVLQVQEAPEVKPVKKDSNEIDLDDL